MVQFYIYIYCRLFVRIVRGKYLARGQYFLLIRCQLARQRVGDLSTIRTSESSYDLCEKSRLGHPFRDILNLRLTRYHF